LNNKLDELLQEFGGRRCKSMIALENEKEDDPRMLKTFPLSPRARNEYDEPFNFNDYVKEQPDNVYAEGKPANPLGREGKIFVDADT